MGVYKDKDRKTWYVEVRYKDIYGNPGKKKKRGFRKASEAKEWEIEFLNTVSLSTDMNFKSLYNLYIDDLSNRVRLSTVITKKYIFEKKILPFFENTKLTDITPITIRNWQNNLLNQNYKDTYLKCINNQLVAIFNYAVKFHNLSKNPCSIAGSIGKKNAEEMNIWSQAEFETFSESIRHKPVSYLAFNILFFTGIRIGELLALTIGDIDFENNTINIDKSFQRINRQDIITPPKTAKSKRKVDCPVSLIDLIRNYIDSLYDKNNEHRLFYSTKSRFEHDLRFYSKKSGLPRIRIHDLRHSHASFLINEHVNIVAVSRRLGHEKVSTTLDTYTHLMSDSNDFIIETLNKIKIDRGDNMETK